MKRRRIGLFLIMAVAFMSMAVVFVGCDWFSDDDEGGGGGGNGATTSKFVVVANTDGGNLSVFKIKSDGTLTFQDNVALSSATKPSMVLLSPNKLFLYVASHDGYINIFSYNSATGALTETEGSPAEYGSEPIQLAITPDGKFLYVTDQGDSQVHIFGVDNTTGDLTYSESVDVSDIHSVAMHPTGNFIYLGTESDEIWAYAIDADTGSLTAVEGTPYFSDFGATWVWLQTTPDGKYLFGAGQDYSAVLAIDNVTGGLTQVALDNTSAWFSKSLVVAPTIPFLYTGNWRDNSIGAYRTNEDGSTDNVAGMPFATGDFPKSLAIAGDSKYLYAVNFGYQIDPTDLTGEGSLTAYSVNRSSGVLTRIGTYTYPAGGKYIVTLP
jgi:6-phosphogluconolactonase